MLPPDPPLGLVFTVANEILARLRVVSRGQFLRQLNETTTFWRVDYLDDEEHFVPVEEGFVRRKSGVPLNEWVTAVTPALWQDVCSQPETFIYHTWDALLLDAEALLPEIGPAIAVANAALETFIPWALMHLYDETVIPVVLWKWIHDREDWYKEPSVAEQFDVILKVLSGRSLKEDSHLWESFMNLRGARNNFSHEGIPMIGNLEVTTEKAAELISRASDIVMWVEALLPQQVRRPKFSGPIEVILSRKIWPSSPEQPLSPSPRVEAAPEDTSPSKKEDAS